MGDLCNLKPTIDSLEPVSPDFLNVGSSIGSPTLIRTSPKPELYTEYVFVESYLTLPLDVTVASFISEPLYKLSKVGGYTFDWNDKQDTYKGHDVGVVAQEIEEVLPQVVTTRGNGYKAVKYEKIVPLLIESIKELNKKIEDIEKNCDCLNK